MSDVTIYVRKDKVTELRTLSFTRADIPLAALLEAGYTPDGHQVMCSAPSDPAGLLAKEREVIAFLESHGHAVVDIV